MQTNLGLVGIQDYVGFRYQKVLVIPTPRMRILKHDTIYPADSYRAILIRPEITRIL